MIKKILNGLLSTISVLGKIGATIIFFVLYGLFSFFFLFVIKGFCWIFITQEWITSETIISILQAGLITHYDTTQVIFVIIFGLAGAMRVLRPSE